VIAQGFANYLGVKRRFEFRIRKADIVFVDDYAHHPEEIRACIAAARDLFPGKRITGVFQPHLFSRTRDFLEEFAASLSLLDEVILMPIYPARELPLPGVSSVLLLDSIALNIKLLCEKEELINTILKLKPEVLLTLGAGDIDQMVEPIEKALNR
jgi:UDP-N-acetylmuramate--alanine ligase